MTSETFPIFYETRCGIRVIARYNALVYVPYQLERLLLFGVLLCFDSFLVRLRTSCWFHILPGS